MNEELFEKQIDEIANRVKNGRDVSKWQKNPHYSSVTKLLSTLANFPKSPIPVANFDRIKNQVLDKVFIPKDMQVVKEQAGWTFSLSQIMRIAAGTVGTLLILISISVGTAVAALQSSPGDGIYPLKKVVENVQLNLTHDPNKKADLQIQFANNRLDELSEVIAKNKSGEISNADAQKIVAQTVVDLKKTTMDASKTSSTQPRISTLNRLVDLSNKQTAILQPLISAASVTDEGQVQILEDALQTSTETKEEAVKNIASTGGTVDNPDPTTGTTPTNTVTAHGEITSLAGKTISIGTAKFIMATDTVFINGSKEDLKEGLIVDITGEVREDDKTYALTITLPAPVDTDDTNSQTTNQNTEIQSDTIFESPTQ